ncbi:hypothetical protein [Photobacterium sp. TY1-4]|uniref:hypothetical protein n=1 Tax=Photobacterium sp. TY1-4 TaxID=2899122 RepID=UPI0021C0C396|nr:hypothetical protein [Photobacterium sp. TY1-4]UXI00773.1 hypothetical protein NH461_13330 [Photobacterium sp. TY1-4]
MSSKKYKWNNLSRVPEAEGVYAWYLPLKISSKDISILIDKVNKNKAEGLDTSAKQDIKEFIEGKILNFYNEEPYDVSLDGALKPKYKGKVQHIPTISDSLVQRLYDDPPRLIEIGQVLISTAPNFASPIYIGMAKNLKSRIRKHQSLIQKYASRDYIALDGQSLSDEDRRDHNFAARVVARGIPETNMFVFIQEISTEIDTYKDIENLLNRINYPVLGKN